MAGGFSPSQGTGRQTARDYNTAGAIVSHQRDEAGVVLREVNPKTEPDVVDAIMRLRHRVWSAAMPVPLTLEDVIDRFEQGARHWIAIEGDVVVAAARLSIHDRLEDVPEADCIMSAFTKPPPAPIGFLSRLVVAPEHRRRGLSRQLDDIRIRAAVEAGCGSLLAIVYDVSGEGRIKRFLANGFQSFGRGRRDTHAKFKHLAEPTVVMRLLQME